MPDLQQKTAAHRSELGSREHADLVPAVLKRIQIFDPPRPERNDAGGQEPLTTPGLRRFLFTMKRNPRSPNGNLRRKYRARIKAQGGVCGICHGRLGPIHYDEPSDAQHPLSFVIDEIRPISRWREFGYDSAEEAARDWTNLQAAHYICNQSKGNKLQTDPRISARIFISDGEW